MTPVAHRQLVLFDAVHDLRAGMRHGFPPPQHQGMAAHLERLVGELSLEYGWSKPVRERTVRGIRILLGIQDTPGAPINASDVEQLATIGIGVPTVMQVLEVAGMLHEDRIPTIERWFANRTAGLPEPMRAERGSGSTSCATAAPPAAPTPTRPGHHLQPARLRHARAEDLGH